MKVTYSSLRCPHCGSSKFHIFSSDVFLCEYCNEKFHFDLEEIDFSSENKVLIEELKTEFYGKINDINKEKIKFHERLLYYKTLASPKKLIRFSIAFLVFSIALLLASLSSIMFLLPFFLVSLACTIASATLFIYTKNRNKKIYNKHKNLIAYYANKVVECENEISVYATFISKLTE